MLIFQCIECGKSSKAYGDKHKGKFCSRACFHAWQWKNAKCWIDCEVCGKRARNVNEGARYCSKRCEARARSGAGNHRWLDVPRTKTCEACGQKYGPKPTGTTDFVRSRFCSRECCWNWQKGQRLHRETAPLTNKHGNRGNRHAIWREAVLQRDKGTCQRCGATGVEMHAHHIKSYKDHPELRYDVGNGETMCCVCHWQEHAKSDVNGVNSGNTAPGQAGGNPEPSHGRKVVEGATVRGRACRRVEASCEQCGAYIFRAVSDIVGKNVLFCSKKCAGLYKRSQPRKVEWIKVNCLECNKVFSKSELQAKAYPKHFCGKSCSASYNNKKRYNRPTAVNASKSAPHAS